MLKGVARWISARPATKLQEIVYPALDLSSVDNPIPTLIEAPQFEETVKLIEQTPGSAHSLLPSIAQALIFCLVRNQRPEQVVEIGSFRGGTAECICRALQANGHGMLHTIGPFDKEHFLPIFQTWPQELQSHLKFYPTSSADFYMLASKQRLRAGIVFVDGNHDYEYALFDIQCAANMLTTGGFILVDNVSQAGPYFAAKDFIRANPDWISCDGRETHEDLTKAFDPHRHLVPGTDFIVLRAPSHYSVGGRPKTFGEISITFPSIKEIKLDIADPARGVLSVQCVLRGFGGEVQVERVGEGSVTLDGKSGEVVVSFADPIKFDRKFDAYRAEPWLMWNGETTLKLATVPEVA